MIIVNDLIIFSYIYLNKYNSHPKKSMRTNANILYIFQMQNN